MNYLKIKIPYKYLLYGFIGFLVGCGTTDSRNNKPSQEEESQIKQRVIENANSIDSVEIGKIISKYNANSSWDTLSFTYQIEEKLVEGNDFASLKADLQDIIRKDTTYYIKLLNKEVLLTLKSSIFNEVRLFLKISKNQLSQLKKVNMSFENALGFGKTGIFIFKAKDISNYNVKVLDTNFNEITGETSEQGNDSNILLIKGDLIDFYLFKN